MPTPPQPVKLGPSQSSGGGSEVRICSFLPSATETLYALGLGEQVAGVTYECDFPPQVQGKPVVVHSRLPRGSSSAEIHRRVSEFVARGESLYRVDMEELARLEPDLIVTQDLCHVCAASPGDLGDALARLPRLPRVVTLSPRTLADVFSDILRLGEAGGRPGAPLVADLKAQVAKVEKAVAGAGTRPQVLCLEWLDPPFIAGHWVPEMVERAGGADALGRAGEPSRQVGWETILASRPDVIAVMPCGYRLAETVAEFRRTTFPAGWEQLPGVKAGRVYALDANGCFSRPGPRLVSGLALLAQLLHPDRVDFSPPPGAVEPLS